jgi:hypothetical protein
MESTTATIHRVQLSPADLQAIIAAQLPTLVAANAVLIDRSNIPGQRVAAGAMAFISFPLSTAALQKALAAEVPGLPATFSLQVVRGNPNVAAVVTWSA